jgi:hypothetical protein
VYPDTLLYVKSLPKACGIVAAALASAAVFGVGIPLAWVWVASQLEANVGQATSDLPALVVIAGPLISYIVLIGLAGRFIRPPQGAAHQRMPWNRSRDEARDASPSTTSADQVILLATFLIGAAFEVWFFFFAHQRVWGS